MSKHIESSQFVDRTAMGVCLVLLLVCTNAFADLVLDVNGTPSSATITASVTNSDVFMPGGGGVVLQFFLAPNVSDVDVAIEGPLGAFNPWSVRGPSDGSYLNFVQISSGDFSTFQLDQNNSLTSSANVVKGNITDLAVFDGVTSTMSVLSGTGPALTPVTLHYNVAVPEPSAFLFTGFLTSVVGSIRWAKRRLASPRVVAKPTSIVNSRF